MGLRQVLGRVKRTPSVNRIGRTALRGLANRCRSFSAFEAMVRRWAVAGVVDVDRWGLRFRYSSDGDDPLADLLYYEPEHEVAETGLFVELARHCGTVMDVGANTGLNAVLAALANPAGTVHAFEPHPNNFARLRRNVSLNGLSNIRAYQEALGAEVGELELTIPSDGSITMVSSAVPEFAAGFYGEAQKRIRVPTRTVDAFVRDEGVGRIDFLKLDVEYYEREVLAGAVETIEAHAPLIWCEVIAYQFAVHTMPRFNRAVDPSHSAQLEAFMRERGYAFYSIHPSGLVRVETLDYSPSQDNFLFSRLRSPEQFLPYTEMDAIRGALMGG